MHSFPHVTAPSSLLDDFQLQYQHYQTLFHSNYLIIIFYH